MIKRSKLLDLIVDKISNLSHNETVSTFDIKRISASLLLDVEQFLEPKVRPLTEKEVEDHVLVKQVHHSRKDEVRNYVRSLEYEWKREYLPEDD